MRGGGLTGSDKQASKKCLEDERHRKHSIKVLTGKDTLVHSSGAYRDEVGSEQRTSLIQSTLPDRNNETCAVLPRAKWKLWPHAVRWSYDDFNWSWPHRELCRPQLCPISPAVGLRMLRVRSKLCWSKLSEQFHRGCHEWSPQVLASGT